MAKDWKPAIEDSAVAARQQRVLGPKAAWRSRDGWRMPSLAIGTTEVRAMLIAGIILGLIVAFTPNLFQWDHTPSKRIPVAVERRIIAERTRERIGDGERPIAGDPHESAIEYRPPADEDDDSGNKAAPEPYLL